MPSTKNVELDHADEATTYRRWRHLRRVNGGANRRCAHADAAEEPGDHEDCVVVGQRGTQRAEDIQDADGEQHLLAAEQVGHLSGNQRAGDGADKRDCYRETEAAVREVEHRFERVGGTGDHGGVESEHQAAERSDNCASNHEWIHAQHRRHE